MPVGADTLRLLLAAGVTGDDLVAIVRSIDAEQSGHKSPNADRQARYRARKRNGVTSPVTDDSMSDVTRNVTDVTPETVTSDVTRNATSSSFSLLNQKEKEEDRVTALHNLEAVLDPVHAKAVYDHRRKIKAPLTAHAAGLLAKQLAKADNPNEAADVMIANGWRGFSVEWMQARKATGPPGMPDGAKPNPDGTFSRWAL